MGQQIYLCRHGQTQWNKAKILQGQLDSPLTEEGQAQAEQLAQKAKSWPVELVVSSHLGRAVRTANIVAATLNKPRLTLPGFCERHFGAWQGKQTAELPDYQAFRKHRYTRPDLMPNTGGESANMVTARFYKTFAQLFASHACKGVMIISHGDAMACLAQSFDKGQVIDNCGGMLLRWEDNKLRWEKWLD